MAKRRRHPSLQTRQKMSAAHKGQGKGRKLEESTKRKIALAMKKHWATVGTA